MRVTDAIALACPTRDLLRDWHLLTEPQRVLCTLDVALGDVYNGGLEQFYFNSSGNLAPALPWALNEVGAGAVARVVEEANRLFEDATLGAREARIRQLSPRSSKTLDTLTSEFYTADEDCDTWALILDYIERHGEVFFTDETARSDN